MGVLSQTATAAAAAGAGAAAAAASSAAASASSAAAAAASGNAGAPSLEAATPILGHETDQMRQIRITRTPITFQHLRIFSSDGLLQGLLLPLLPLPHRLPPRLELLWVLATAPRRRRLDMALLRPPVATACSPRA